MATRFWKWKRAILCVRGRRRIFVSSDICKILHFSNVDTSNAFAIGSRNITSGGATTGGSLFFTGLIDEVFIFDNALNATEISNLKQFNDINGAVVEPASFAGFAVGLVGLGLLRRRARR